MANSTSHFLPLPIRNARYSLQLGFRVAAGTPTDPTTPDTELSTDGGASFADTTEEITTGGGNGMGYVTLTATEMDNVSLAIAVKSANCLTTMATVTPLNLAILSSGTASAGAAGTLTLGTVLTYDITGCYLRTTGGTGGGTVNNQARVITAYNTSTGVATVVPNWATTPDNTTTYDVLLPPGVTVGMVNPNSQLLPTTPVANTIGEALFIADNLVGRINTAQAGAASSITLDASASAADGRYVGYAVYLYGGTGGGVRGVGQERTITAYNGTTKVATVAQSWGTNPDNTSKFMLFTHPFSNVGIWNGTVVATPATAGIPDVNAKNWNNLATVALPLIPTVAGRTLDVSAGGEAGVDWANVGSPTTTLNLSGTTIASVTGAVGSVTGAVGSVTGNVGGNVTGSVGSVAGAVGSVTGNVGGNVTGSVGSVVGAVGSVTGSVASVTGNVGGNVVGSVASVVGNVGGSVAGNVTGSVSSVLGSVGGIAGTVTTFDGALAALASAHGAGSWATATAVNITGLTAADVQNMATRFLGMIEVDGGVYRYTTNALEQAPSGGGGGGSTAEDVINYDFDGDASPLLSMASLGRLMLNKKVQRLDGPDVYMDVYDDAGATVLFSIPLNSGAVAGPVVGTGSATE